MDTSKINKSAKTLVNILVKSEDVFLLTQEINKILSQRKKDLAISIASSTLNQALKGTKISETIFEKPVNILNGNTVTTHCNQTS